MNEELSYKILYSLYFHTIQILNFVSLENAKLYVISKFFYTRLEIRIEDRQLFVYHPWIILLKFRNETRSVLTAPLLIPRSRFFIPR